MVQFTIKLFQYLFITNLETLDENFELAFALVQLNISSPDHHTRLVLTVLTWGHYLASKLVRGDIQVS